LQIAPALYVACAGAADRLIGSEFMSAAVQAEGAAGSARACGQPLPASMDMAATMQLPQRMIAPNVM